MNKKKIVIISSIVLTLFLIVFVISYVITKNINKQENNSMQLNSKKEEKENNTTDLPSKKDKEEFKQVNIQSIMANDLFEFIPKYFLTQNNKMTNEYIIYSALTNLTNKNTKTEYTINDTFNAYKFEDVLESAKNIYGNDIKIEYQTTYKLPIESEQKNNLFCLLPSGMAGTEEHLVLKEIKENNEKFILVAYAVKIEYDIEEPEYINIATKDTFKLYTDNITDMVKLKNTMKKYKLIGIDLPVNNIVNEFKDSLPTIQYEIIKKNYSGEEYYIKDIKTIVD